MNSNYNVVCMSSGDLLIWRNFEFWSTNICYRLLLAPQNQFKTEKKRVWLVNVLSWTNKRFTFSVKKKCSYFKIQNFVKLANHRMTYIFPDKCHLLSQLRWKVIWKTSKLLKNVIAIHSRPFIHISEKKINCVRRHGIF